MKEKEKEEVAIQKQYDKQCAVKFGFNACELKELAAKRNEYRVLLSLPFDSFLKVLTFVVQTDEHEEPPRPAPLTPFPTNPPVANPFEIFNTHATMQAINAHLVPCFIADVGSDYADFGNNETATAMITHVITTERRLH